MENELSIGSGCTMTGGPQSFMPHQSQEEGGGVLQPTSVGILLVDDDEDVRCLVAAMLEDADYRVYSAESGKQAIMLFQENLASIDLLVSDVVMPMMNGREVYEQLNKLKPGLPTVFISGYPSEILKNMQFTKNVKFLAKPLCKSILVKTVQAALQS